MARNTVMAFVKWSQNIWLPKLPSKAYKIGLLGQTKDISSYLHYLQIVRLREAVSFAQYEIRFTGTDPRDQKLPNMKSKCGLALHCRKCCISNAKLLPICSPISESLEWCHWPGRKYYRHQSKSNQQLQQKNTKWVQRCPGGCLDCWHLPPPVAQCLVLWMIMTYIGD